MSGTKRADLNKERGRRSVWLRKPRGAKQAKIRGDRKVPPTSWDDVITGSETVKQSQRKMR